METHKLTVDEMPDHSHHYFLNTTGNPTITARKWSLLLPNNYTQITTERQVLGGDTTIIGNDEPHNNLQPYFVVKIYKRIS